MRLRQDNGTNFIGVEPPEARTIPVGLQFPVGRMLADGVLFIPPEMEHKWAIFFHGQRMLFIRSGQRRVLAVAEVEIHDDHVIVTRLRGTFVETHEEPSYTVRVMDYLLRSHALTPPTQLHHGRAWKRAPETLRYGACRGDGAARRAFTRTSAA